MGEFFSKDDNDFTLDRYRDLIRVTKDRWRFLLFGNPDRSTGVLWRHDVDISLERAVQMARVEAEENVATTYFINLHSEFFNALEVSQVRLIREIVDLGHQVGVHFWTEAYAPSDLQELEMRLRREASLLADLSETPVQAFSWHKPSSADLRMNVDRLGGLINAYSAELFNTDRYCSDANGYWRFHRLYDLVSSPDAPNFYQVLIHPDWWMESPTPIRFRVHQAVEDRARASMRQYDVALAERQRFNYRGPVEQIAFLQHSNPDLHWAIDRAWSNGHYGLALVMLWRYANQSRMDGTGNEQAESGQPRGVTTANEMQDVESDDFGVLADLVTRWLLSDALLDDQSLVWALNQLAQALQQAPKRQSGFSPTPSHAFGNS